jgi:site-specific DNA recombinase
LNRNSRHPAPDTLPLVRCAIYTRKSTDEGLEQAFNSLDAQRESAEAFIRSQAAAGWACRPERYDDGGFTGGNLERPALQRLLADIAAGQVDCVVVYKVDRLSRSLLDFARLMQTFDQYQVAFASVTQQFNTATSMGRLVLNVLLSFAQFEREIIAERTRDKVAATRRKGKWSGGTPLLGYDLDPRGGRLVLNEDEAERVRAIFTLYLEHEALLPVVQELERRGWRTKHWRTRQGHERGGQLFTKTSLYRLLTNVVYVGKVRYKDEIHDGEQPALVDPDIFGRVQALLRSHGPVIGPPVRGRCVSLLKGLLRCLPCGCAMTPAHTTRKGCKRYRYYVCSGAQKRGWHSCPSRSVPAAPMEQLVLGQLQALGRDPAVLGEVLAQVRRQDEAHLAELEGERGGLERDLGRWHAELRRLLGQVAAIEPSGAVVSRLAELQARIGSVEQRLARIRAQVEAVRQQRLDEAEAARALAAFGPRWVTLPPSEQVRLVRLLVARVDYDGAAGKVTLTFQPSGLKTLAGEWAAHNAEEECA